MQLKLTNITNIRLAANNFFPERQIVWRQWKPEELESVEWTILFRILIKNKLLNFKRTFHYMRL